jgi:hypothetical protein
MKAETLVSIYAAIIGTSAFFLNLKSWWDSGVKLSLSIMADGMTIGAGPAFDEQDLIILTVTNRGDAPTVITNMIVFEILSPLQRWRIRPAKSYVITNPQLKGYPLNVPSDLEPSKRWTGAIRKRDDLGIDLHDGRHYTGVYTSSRDRPYLIRIPKKSTATLPEGTTPLKS